MSDPVIVSERGGGGMAAFGVVAVLAIAILIGLFVWHPWSVTTTRATTTTQQPGAPANGSSTTNSTTTTTNGHP